MAGPLAAFADASLRHTPQFNDEEPLYIRAGRAIYGLRNQIVHYRPELGGHLLADDQWNELCKRMVGIVFQVFSHAFP